ncbi:MAG: dTDP-glucose 4,6-dehydratase [Myxococcota bacterium]|nr:dTDP-glucose 4,6-dehydratase [Myxococcota bacterium]
MKRILVTGGSGFIGSNFLNLAVGRFPKWTFINVDKLTYAGNPLSTQSLNAATNYSFERVDICDETAVREVFLKFDPHWVIHFAAESHVDRSIFGPRDFLETNVMGTLTLLEACRGQWSSFDDRLFYHVSTDEVYGSLGAEGLFHETTAYDPSSPYSASKAASDHLVRAYYRTYGLPVKISNCSNNYGPYQFPEKLIPLMILNALEGRPLPVYGTGENVRDWLYVEDHCEAILMVADKGKIGQTYNIGGRAEKKNIDVVTAVCDAVAKATKRDPGDIRSLITFVKDRPGHDFRYAIDSSKVEKELGWRPRVTFASGIAETVDWYLNHRDWVDGIRTGEYKKWIEVNYGQRGQSR